MDVLLLYPLRTQCSVNLTFICAGKPSSSSVAVVWNRTRIPLRCACLEGTKWCGLGNEKAGPRSPQFMPAYHSAPATSVFTLCHSFPLKSSESHSRLLFPLPSMGPHYGGPALNVRACGSRDCSRCLLLQSGSPQTGGVSDIQLSHTHPKGQESRSS